MTNDDEREAPEERRAERPANLSDNAETLAEFGTFPEGDIVRMGSGVSGGEPLKVVRAVFFVPIIPDNIQPDEWIVNPSWTELAEMIWRIREGAYKGCKLFLEDDSCMAIGGEGEAFTCQTATPAFSVCRMLNPQAAEDDELGRQAKSGRSSSNDALAIEMALEAAQWYSSTGEMLQTYEWKKLY